MTPDLRLALRTLVRHKAFTIAAVATLAIGIGANAAIFSVVNGVILRPLPFAAPERLVQLRGTNTMRTGNEPIFSLDEYRTQSTSFDGLAGYEVSARYLRSASGTERVMTVQVERDFFAVLGVAPRSGRTFGRDDPSDVAVISAAFWRRLGGLPSVIGSPLRFDDQTLTIVGIMPDAFQFPYGAASLLQGVAAEARTDVWMPFAQPLRPRSRIGNVTGRLRGGVTLAAAQADVSGIARQLETRDAANTGRGIALVPLAESVVSGAVRRPLVVLFIAVALVLALACANVTNLLLVRTTIRRREIAVRAALGAGRWRLVRQVLTETLLVSAIGGAIGFVVAWVATRRLVAIAEAQIPRAHEVGLDWRVFAFLLIACGVAGALAGLAPALATMRLDPHGALQESGGRATMGRGQRRLRDALVVAEVALACVLAISASTLIGELQRLRRSELGMNTSNVLTLHLGHRMTAATDTSQFYAIADRVAELPGVEAAGFTQMLPLQNWGWSSNSTDFRWRGGETPATSYSIELRYVTPGYFEALGIPIRRGRGFTDDDRKDSLPVVIINETLARRAFGDRDPIGIETTRGVVVGVIADVRQSGVDAPALPEIYYAIAQNWSQVSELGLTLAVRTRERPEPAIGAIRSVIAAVNPGLAIFSIKTMDRVVSDALADFTLFLWLMSLFALVAIGLAMTGTYGVLAFVAASRTREFAVRTALGADRSQVIRLVLSEGLMLTALGLAAGVTLAVLAAPLSRQLPVSLPAVSIAAALPVVVLIAAIALAACWIPAARAARVDPIASLRAD